MRKARSGAAELKGYPQYKVRRARALSEQYSLAKILGIWALRRPDGHPGLDRFPATGTRFSSHILSDSASPCGAAHAGLDLVVRPVHDHGPPRGRRPALGYGQEEAQAQRPAGAPATGRPRARLWLWVVPFLVAIAVVELVLNTPLENAWVSSSRSLRSLRPRLRRVLRIASDPAAVEGAWWFFALFVVHAVFNTILGEEFLFRGVLLPQMEGVFGRWSWVANGVLFGLYHVHEPWGIPNAVLTGLLYTLPRLSLQEHVDVYRPPLCTECVLRLLGARGRVGPSLELAPMAQLLMTTKPSNCSTHRGATAAR